MKKRSMLAIASLATGFVVAAITPSHGLEAADALGKTDGLSKLDVEGTLGKVGKTVSSDSLAGVDEDALGGHADQEGKGGKEG
ncbi:hypothetical protein PV729_12935 [Streptomyces europaeiscabiei]|uniref:Secreted protein n=1 Tax=Streptomyces europaeiscabiei TaxID=146819 RepID=A0ABU4NTA5_9ACTN|nr:hypothetical protein [Streptomyces europaeiscabiei]MDX2761402.1 hypothetical protein [Streptomyces europaeiscabiei]MDX2767611.1 hypothetical protein [Streptomyces europaeiscabiei]MDX3548459.1 hypothetical protein [Streptomyces europaeiscabiei]MDX3552653.1 hypothetical protein [Streptomyces europaeiscabiei]MDX3705892.1 hypothetical protein [Streptomyces europaeiscabiei]